MIRRYRLSAALAAVFASATPALAQDNADTLPPAQVRAFMAKFAACSVRQNVTKTRIAVAEIATGKKGRVPFDEECGSANYYQATMRMPDDVLNYAVADALYRADFGRTAPTSFDAVPLSAPLPLAPDAATNAAEIAKRYRMIVADCIVRSEPGLAHALLTANVETRGEQAAIVALQPVIGGCLPAGQTAQFTKDSLRGLLALTAYRLRRALPTES